MTTTAPIPTKIDYSTLPKYDKRVKFLGTRTVINTKCESCFKEKQCQSLGKKQWLCSQCNAEIRYRSDLAKVIGVEQNNELFNEIDKVVKAITISLDLVEKITPKLEAVIDKPELKEGEEVKPYILGRYYKTAFIVDSTLPENSLTFLFDKHFFDYYI